MNDIKEIYILQRSFSFGNKWENSEAYFKKENAEKAISKIASYGHPFFARIVSIEIGDSIE
jgi:hypothetical protein